ncbi:MAG: flavin-dependent oxidoreductase [Rhodobacteraceae bacterium]|nr:flavin-dependent oxidoreductase [Paracoccaceae bacterium]
MTVIISGAGIGGLTMALTCHDLGIPVKVFEAVPEIKPLGVGINLQPHAVREIYEMGLEAEIEAIGVRTQDVTYFSKLGLPIHAEERGIWAGYKWPQYSIHRGELQMMLLRAVQDRLGADAVETGAAVVGFEEDADGVRVMVDRHGDISEIRGDVLIGADGLHSKIRAGFYPEEGAPIWAGAVLWRGTTKAAPFLSGASMAMAGHESQKFVTYPISTPDENGKAVINWIAELKFNPDADWNREDYNRQGQLADFLPAFENWNFDWLDIPALIKAADTIYEFPMIDRDPLERWSFGRVTLLGDAAHAMYPIGSNGATQAILDARMLGRCFVEHGINTEALSAYDADRRPKCNAVVLANRGNGPDQVMQVVEDRTEGDFDNINDVLSEAERLRMATAYKKIAGFDVDILNNAPSIITKGMRVD